MMRNEVAGRTNIVIHSDGCVQDFVNLSALSSIEGRDSPASQLHTTRDDFEIEASVESSLFRKIPHSSRIDSSRFPYDINQCEDQYQDSTVICQACGSVFDSSCPKCELCGEPFENAELRSPTNVCAFPLAPVPHFSAPETRRSGRNRPCRVCSAVFSTLSPECSICGEPAAFACTTIPEEPSKATAWVLFPLKVRTASGTRRPQHCILASKTSAQKRPPRKRRTAHTQSPHGLHPSPCTARPAQRA
jgi:hypothetical protein